MELDTYYFQLSFVGKRKGIDCWGWLSGTGRVELEGKMFQSKETACTNA